MRFESSPQLASEAQNELRRTILPFAAATPMPADIKAGSATNRHLQLAVAEPHPHFTRPVPETVPPASEAPPAPKLGIPDAAAQGVDLLNSVGQRRLAPKFAFESFVSGLGTMNISRAAAAKLTETFAISLQKAAAQHRTQETGNAARVEPSPSPSDGPIGIRSLQPDGPSPNTSVNDTPQASPQGSLPLEPAINVARDGKSDPDTRTPQGLVLDGFAETIGKAEDLLNTDMGNGTLREGLEVFGGAADEMVRRSLGKVPFFGETLVERRDQFNEEMGMSFGRLADKLRRFFELIGRHHGLSDESARNLGKIGPLIAGTMAPGGGSGGRRPRGQGNRPTSTDLDGSANVRNEPADLDKTQIPSALQVPDESITDIRVRHNLPDRNTVAAGQTDIPGLDQEIFAGISPIPRREAGLPTLDQQFGSDRRISAPSRDPRFNRHAEEDILNAMDVRIREAGLKPEDLTDRSVSIVISNTKGGLQNMFGGYRRD